MNTIESFILYSFIIITLVLTIFIIVVTCWKIMKENQRLKKRKQIEVKLEKEMLFNRKELKKTSFFQEFYEVLKETDLKKEYLEKLEPVIPTLTNTFKKKNLAFQSYYINFLNQYPYLYEKDENTLSYLKNSVTSSSIYVRDNALKAIFKTKNIKRMKDALTKLNEYSKTHPKKLMTELFINYTGNKEELVDILLTIFDALKEEYKVAIVNFFSYDNISRENFLLKKIADAKEEKEVRLACIRYFQKRKDKRVLPYLYLFIETEEMDWEYSSISALTLKSYPSKKTTEILLSALESKNWYVRNNAAASLVFLEEPKKLKELLKTNDYYIKRSLYYQIKKQGKVV